jgi:hypothetical protein
MSCEKCLHPELGYNTGEIGQGGYLDCACGVADERAAFEDQMTKQRRLPLDARDWHAYQLGKAAALKQFTTNQKAPK